MAILKVKRICKTNGVIEETSREVLSTNEQNNDSKKKRRKTPIKDAEEVFEDLGE